MKKTVIYYIIAQSLGILIAFANEYALNFTASKGNDSVISDYDKWMYGVIIGPLFETLVFNSFLNEVLIKIIPKKNVVIIISSLAFGLIHDFSYIYMISTFFVGFILNTFYFYLRNEYGIGIAFLVILMLHANHNFIGILLGK
ncbi:MAG TPA: CPBP family glutamic-type intramembrane protease [Saprospiraceae bacterium]|nr:CPBP family glutamic-type intramembrane protease [Saprospiraceae bacterium]HMU02012.1 CPBP family glutamic-type intramembrane protease [Saprospiraceae bacterium]